MRKDSRLMEFNTMINRLLRANPESGKYPINMHASTHAQILNGRRVLNNCWGAGSETCVEIADFLRVPAERGMRADRVGSEHPHATVASGQALSCQRHADQDDAHPRLGATLDRCWLLFGHLFGASVLVESGTVRKVHCGHGPASAWRSHFRRGQVDAGLVPAEVRAGVPPVADS